MKPVYYLKCMCTYNIIRVFRKCVYFLSHLLVRRRKKQAANLVCAARLTKIIL